MQSLILYFIALKEKRLMACIILKMTLLVKIRLTFEKRAALQRRPLSQSPCPTQADGLSTLMTRNSLPFLLASCHAPGPVCGAVHGFVSCPSCSRPLSASHKEAAEGSEEKDRLWSPTAWV